LSNANIIIIIIIIIGVLRNISWGDKPVRIADNLITFMYRLSRNLGNSASWNSHGL